MVQYRGREAKDYLLREVGFGVHKVNCSGDFCCVSS